MIPLPEKPAMRGERASAAQADRAPEGWNGVVVRLRGYSAYNPVWRLQQTLWDLRRRLEICDTLILLEHRPIVTIGRHGDDRNVRPASGAPPEVVRIDRGGDVTYHGPGQLTAYFICDLAARDLAVRGFVERLEDAVCATLREFGIRGERRAGLTGVWARDENGWAKVAALGVRVARHTSLHGVALNVGGCLDGFRDIVPCGLAGERVTSIEVLSGRAPAIDVVADALARGFASAFGLHWRTTRWDPIDSDEDGARLVEHLRETAHLARRPHWLRAGLPAGRDFARVRAVLAAGGLHTVCASARCPNRQECWDSGTATFLILGEQCTRRCRFCSVAKGAPGGFDAGEAERVAAAAASLGLKHVVVTSVTRDDLPDGGAGAFAATIAAIRARLPHAAVEVLIPDFAGSAEALKQVLDASPAVLNHNVETVPRLYPLVRPGADIQRSLAILKAAAARGIPAKSGFMVGLGESERETRELLRMLRGAGCERVTIGQYLQPTRRQLPVQRYFAPDEFAELRRAALELGFSVVAADPLVRSSYHAGRIIEGDGSALGTAG